MQNAVKILLGVSINEDSHSVSFLTEIDQSRYHVNRAGTTNEFLFNAESGQFQIFIVSYRFISESASDFLSIVHAKFSSVPKILLCTQTELESALKLLCNNFDDCILYNSITPEKIANCLEAIIKDKLNEPSIAQSDPSSIQKEGETIDKPDFQKFYDRFIRISSTTNDAVWEWNLAENSLWANENHQLLYGLTVNDPVPAKQEWADRIHPTDRQRLLDMQDHALSSNTNVFISEYRFRTKEGYKYIFDRCYIERDSYGNPILMTGSMMDITPRKLAEEKIIHSNERFELIARTTNEALWETDLISGYTWSNETHQQLYGLTLKDSAPLQEQWENNIHPHEREAVLKSFYDAFHSNQNVWISEYRMFNFQGDEIDIYDRTYIVRNAEGKPIRMMGSMTDISERKRASEELRKSEEKYRLLVEQATDAIFIADVSGQFMIVNPAAVKLSQYSEEELMQMTIYDLADPEELKIKPFAFAKMKSENGASSERRLRRKDGALVDIEINAKFLSDGRFLAFVRDITERKKAENELQNSYKAIRKLTSHLQQVREEERKHMARNIHDELGQLLTVLKMDISWLNRKVKALQAPDLSQKADQIIQILNNTVQTVRRISADLRPGLLDDLGLSAAIEWHLGDFAKRSGIRTNFHASDAAIELSPEQATSLFRIYQESITNIARHAAATEITVELSVEVNDVSLCVTDNGTGFDIAVVNKRKTLGLLGMKERAEMMGGSFSVSKNSEAGTKIMVQIPILSNQVSSKTKA